MQVILSQRDFNSGNEVGAIYDCVKTYTIVHGQGYSSNRAVSTLQYNTYNTLRHRSRLPAGVI